nr:MAG TPA: hypothetical protein [Caudoviricetes sp.]DAY07492.1 MAG TPA: hypothetical protein [Caudoviricetes sp.]
MPILFDTFDFLKKKIKKYLKNKNFFKTSRYLYIKR